MLFSQSLDVIGSVWTHALLGSGLALVGTGLGWAMGAEDSIPPVRLIAWWVRNIAQPLLRCRRWWIRAATIFLNNAVILLSLVAIGHWRIAAVVAVAGLGVSLGIGLRLLSDMPSDAVVPTVQPNRAVRRRINLGVGLNLLEPPAIMLAIGLSLGRQTISLETAAVWVTFAVWVVPLTLVAAAGEAIWLGECQREEEEPDPNDARSSDSDTERRQGEPK